tara:strand:+ start:164 stop:745 length:582 start_codon:yes stop_codon:yes gene_type:complete
MARLGMIYINMVSMQKTFFILCTFVNDNQYLLYYFFTNFAILINIDMICIMENKDKIIDILNEIMKYELSGVVRYTHYALMVTGRDRLSLTQFFKEQATESLLHAQQAGELVTGLDGHPSLDISIIEESNKHNSIDLLNESASHEKNAVSLYKDLEKLVSGESIYLEEYAREMIKAEEIHSIEIQKMLKDFSV